MRGGRLEIARWLVDTFGLTVEDARADGDFALYWACLNGHLGTAQWLAETFKLIAEKGRGGVGQEPIGTPLSAVEVKRSTLTEIWQGAQERGFLSITDWLDARFR